MDVNVTELEQKHVKDVYDIIADHFSCTRSKPWPNVAKFVNSLKPGATLLDVGCGNGKYFGLNSQIIETGVDTNEKLLRICLEKGLQVVQGSCLQIPFKDASFDAVICIAVIHHLGSEERRLHALKEVSRVLREDGEALIYVWAKEQRIGSQMSTYMKQKRSNRRSGTNKVLPPSAPSPVTPLPMLMVNLPVHENRMAFVSQDVFVPWKLKKRPSCVRQQKENTKLGGNNSKNCTNHEEYKSDEEEHKMSCSKDESNNHTEPTCQTLYRYYHVFREAELSHLCSNINNITVLQNYYDEGNWCVRLKKL